MGRSVSDVGDPRESDIASHTSSHRQNDNVRVVHQVGLPTRKKLATELKDGVKETFFHDDPLRPFKGQSKGRKVLLGFQTFFPILEWGRHYNFSKFKGDLIAGLTIASLCIPQVTHLDEIQSPHRCQCQIVFF